MAHIWTYYMSSPGPLYHTCRLSRCWYKCRFLDNKLLLFNRLWLWYQSGFPFYPPLLLKVTPPVLYVCSTELFKSTVKIHKIKTLEKNCCYRKILKNSDTRKICCNHPKSWRKWPYHRVTHPKDADRIANSEDPDQTKSSLIWVYTVCPDLSVRKLRIVMVLS